MRFLKTLAMRHPWRAFVVVHVVALGLAWGVAQWVNAHVGEPVQPHAPYMRLIPLGPQ